MAHLHIAVFGTKPDGSSKRAWVYHVKPLTTSLFYEMGSGFSFPFSNGEYWSGTIYFVMNYGGYDETIYLDVIVGWEIYERLLNDPAWSTTDPGEQPEGSSKPATVRHLRLVPKDDKPPE